MTRLLILGVLLMSSACSIDGATPAQHLPDPAVDHERGSTGSAARRAVFAGGCFWCVEGVFEQLAGVAEVVSGYAGGDPAQADYQSVSAGATDHAEVVQISYDPAQISYGQLLKVFFATHDPTQLNRQGPDTGRQYRSAVFYADEQQKETAAAYIGQLEQAGIFDAPIVTTLEPLERFHPAEDYHQDFVRRNPSQPYVQAWALPKVDKTQKLFPDLVDTQQ